MKEICSSTGRKPNEKGALSISCLLPPSSSSLVWVQVHVDKFKFTHKFIFSSAPVVKYLQKHKLKTLKKKKKKTLKHKEWWKTEKWRFKFKHGFINSCALVNKYFCRHGVSLGAVLARLITSSSYNFQNWLWYWFMFTTWQESVIRSEQRGHWSNILANWHTMAMILYWWLWWLNQKVIVRQWW